MRLLLLFFLLSLPWVAPQEVRGLQEGEDQDRLEYEDPESHPRPVGHAVRTPEPPIIDGTLADPAWARAQVIDGFIQSQPVPGAPATERTEVRILYDDDYLYLGILCYESEPGQLIVKTLERDFPGGSTRDMDMVGIALDTFLDRRNSFLFLVNPYGAVRDGQTFDDSRNVDFGWDAAVEVATSIHAEGWTVEMAIPWTSLRFSTAPGEQAWGLNLLRRVRWKNEDSYWAPVDRRNPVHRMSRAGTLTGFQDLPSNRNLSAKPYLLAEHLGGAETLPGDMGAGGNVGFDLKWGITPSLTLDGTFRTDFSQVEVDQERVNLTRFPLFFPEQRDFFVENSGSFIFGDVTERNYRQGASLRDFTLFHSRRIGLRDGSPVPILGGGRLTGQLAGGELGALSMQTEGTAALPGEGFHVLRYRRGILPGTGLGGMLLHRTGGPEGSSTSWGVDGDFRTPGGLIVSSYLAGTRVPGTEGGDALAARLGAGWRTQHWNLSGMHRRIGEGFQPTMGFVRRTGIRQNYATVGTHRRPDLPGVQEMAPWVEVDYLANADGRMVGRTLRVGNQIEFRDGSSIEGRLTEQMEFLANPFRVQGVEVLPGRYDEREWDLSYGSSAARALSGGVSLGAGGFFGGTRRSMGVQSAWQISPHLGLDGSVDWNDVELPAGSFQSNVYRARAKIGFSTRAFASGFVQYNDALDQLVTNVRVNFIHAPLSDLYLVFSERRGLGTATSGSVFERMFALKVTRHLPF